MILLIIAFLLSCTDYCDQVKLSANNDTSKVVWINSVHFDTTATKIHGYVVDRYSGKQIEGARAEIFCESESYSDTSDAHGEFDIFKNLKTHGDWTIKITHPDYRCLEVTNAILGGGTWIKFKLETKND